MKFLKSILSICRSISPAVVGVAIFQVLYYRRFVWIFIIIILLLVYFMPYISKVIDKTRKQ